MIVVLMIRHGVTRKREEVEIVMFRNPVVKIVSDLMEVIKIHVYPIQNVVSMIAVLITHHGVTKRVRDLPTRLLT
jgi:hypothetical protein